MGITLTSNFDVNAALPLDSRLVVADLTARDAIAAGRRYEGMCVYVVSDTLTYQLKAGILNTDWVEYGAGAGAALTLVDQFSGDGVTTTFPLGADPLAVENTQVYIDGVYQQKIDSYDLVGLDIVFVDPPPVGASNIEVVYTTPSSPLVIPNNYITTAKIADDAITTDKVLDNAITTSKILSLDAAKLTGTVNIAQVADGSITAAKLADNSVNTTEIVDGAVSEAKMGSRFFTSNPITNFTTASSSFVDVTNGSFTINRLSFKTIVFKLMAPLNGSLSYVSGINFDIQLVRGATVVGIHRVNFNSGIDIFLPLSMFVWYEDSGTGSATYKLQMRDNLSVGVSITNFRFNWHYL